MKIQITDLQLPERKVSNILSILESNNMPVRVPDMEMGKFNCWGFTAYYHQWVPDAYWMKGEDMEEHLKTHTVPIDKGEVKAGDIAAFYRGHYLTHTAIVLAGGNIVCHKPGMTALCIDTVEAASSSYGTVTYARVKEKEEKNLTTAEGVLL